MATLPAVPDRIPIVDQNGLISRNWQQFFEALLRRVGGTGDVLSNSDVQIRLETDGTPEPLAKLEALRRQVQDLEALTVFLAGSPAPMTEASSFSFGGASVADVEAVRQRLADVEALTIFSW